VIGYGIPSLCGGVPMNQFAFSGWLAALVCGVAGACVAQEPGQTQPPAAQSGDTQALNRPVPASMTCGEIKALLKDDRRTGGSAILWLDGYYSAGSSRLFCLVSSLFFMGRCFYRRWVGSTWR
jgi:hypothetical protein